MDKKGHITNHIKLHASDNFTLLSSEILKRAIPLLLTQPALHTWIVLLWSLNKKRLMCKKLYMTMQFRIQMQIQKNRKYMQMIEGSVLDSECFGRL